MMYPTVALVCSLILPLGTIASATNLNPSFEERYGQVAKGWITDDIEGVRWEATDQVDARTGDGVMRLRGAESRSTTRVRLLSEPFSVRGGDAIEFTAWTRASGTPRQNLLLYVEGERLGQWHRIEPVVDRPQSERWLRDQWVPQGHTVFVPDGTERARLVCSGGINSELRVSWFIDDFSCAIISLDEYVASPPDSADTRLEDIYLVTPDTMTQNVLGCYGARTFTPTIDRIAAEGRLYHQVTTTAPWTKPSFASIMTSLYPSQHTVQDQHYALPLDITTLAEFLKKRGYFTAAFVWSPYDGYLGPYMQFNQGFDIYFYSDDEQLVSQALIDFLGTNQQNLANTDRGGIFVWHHIWEPHTPYTNRTPTVLSNPDGLLGPIDITFEAYRRMIWGPDGYANGADFSYMHDVYQWEAVHTDHLIREAFARFQWAGMLDNLNVVFAADHGESFGERPDAWGHTHGYETCLRTPLIMRLPNRVQPGSGNQDALVSNLDIMPTLLDLAGVPIPDHVEGRSLLASELHHARTSEFGISENLRHGWLTIREDRYKLIIRNASTATDDPTPEHYWTFCDSGIYELYDLQEDPFERNNIAEKQPEVFQRLKAALDDHCQRTGIVCGQAPQGEIRELSEETRETLGAIGYGDTDETSESSLEPVNVGTERGFGNLEGLD